MNTPKRVSFGSTHGSMVETLIIDDMPNDEKSFFADTLLQQDNNKHAALREKDMNSPPQIHVSFANNNNVEDFDEEEPGYTTTTTTTTTTTRTNAQSDAGGILTQTTREEQSIESSAHLCNTGGGDGGGGDGGGGRGMDDGAGTGDPNRTTAPSTTTTRTVKTTTFNIPSDPRQDPDASAAQSSPTSDAPSSSHVTVNSSVRTSDAPSPTSPTSSMASSLTTPGAGKKPGPPIIRLNRSPSTESHENPFMADGELSKKAEYILRHSTISRSEIRISDPDLSKTGDRNDTVTEESPLVRQEAAPVQSAVPEQQRLNGTVDGPVEAALTPQAVQVEVGTANASQPQPQHAEQVKLKDPKCKCCVIM